MEKDIEFLEKVADLFIENGAKTVTMDDIAKELGISKKTLYQKYKNKEALLEVVLTYGMNKILQRIKNLDEEIDNAIERMFCRDEEIERVSHTNNSILLRQLIKYYPHIFYKHMRNFAESFSEILAHNIKRGRKQGYYRENFDAKLYAKIYFQMVMSYDNSPYLNTSEITRYQYQRESLKFYMNSIATEKGREIIRRIGEEEY